MSPPAMEPVLAAMMAKDGCVVDLKLRVKLDLRQIAVLIWALLAQ